MDLFSQIQTLQPDIPLPRRLLEIQQSFSHTKIADVYLAAKTALENSSFITSITPGKRVAIAVGSRGIANLPVIVKAVADTIRQSGGEPFVTPSMGSHGGGTAEGQIQVLANLGVTEQTVGARVVASMEVIEVGQIPNGPKVFQDVLSAAADFTLLIGRIKPHTDFHGLLESGLTKMEVIGLGKLTGAAEMHEWGGAGFRNFLSAAARLYEANSNVLGGLGIIENGYDETERIEALSVSEIGGSTETLLLEEAKRKMASLPFSDIDVLVVRELGKNISGTGMDTNIIGRLMIPREAETPIMANIATIAVLDLTEETHGNASGVGLANVTTWRLAQKINWAYTYTNAITSGVFGMQRVSLPIVMADDYRAIQVAVRGCAKKPEAARIVFIENTLKLERMWISPTLRKDAETTGNVTIIDEKPLEFSSNGSLCSPWLMDEPLV